MSFDICSLIGIDKKMLLFLYGVIRRRRTIKIPYSKFMLLFFDIRSVQLLPKMKVTLKPNFGYNFLLSRRPDSVIYVFSFHSTKKWEKNIWFLILRDLKTKTLIIDLESYRNLTQWIIPISKRKGNNTIFLAEYSISMITETWMRTDVTLTGL